MIAARFSTSLISVFLAAGGLPVRAQYWSFQNSPDGVRLGAVAAATRKVAYAVGSGGKVIKTLDGGATWGYTGATGVTGYLVSAAAAGQDTVYVGTDHKAFLKTEDGGATWRVQAPPDSGLGPSDGLTIWDISAVDGRTAFATNGVAGRILRTRDGGANWEMPATGMPVRSYQISAADARTVYATASGDTLIKSADGGETWTPIKIDTGAGSLVALDALDEDTVVAIKRTGIGAVQANVFLRTCDGGKTWERHDLGASTGWLFDIAAANGESIFAAGYAGALTHTRDGGATWAVEKRNGDRAQFMGISAPDADAAFAVADGGQIAVFNGAGTSLRSRRPDGSRAGAAGHRPGFDALGRAGSRWPGNFRKVVGPLNP